MAAIGHRREPVVLERIQRVREAHDLIATTGLVWRWRAEIALACAVPMVAVPLLRWLGPAAALLLAGAVLAGGAIPGIRGAAGRLVIELRRA